MKEMNFNERCYKLLRKVPRGKVTTYKEIARALDSKAYKAVGNAMNKNPHPGARQSQVPCHRVIKSNGEVGGFASGIKRKIQLLKKEGVGVKKRKINLKKYMHRFR